MCQAFEQIVQGLDQISKEEQCALRDLIDAKLGEANGSPPSSQSDPKDGVRDPLAGLRVSTGIQDLADRFDEYRFGRNAR